MDRLHFYFSEYFSEDTKPTARNLFHLVLAMICLDGFRSVHFAHKFILSLISSTSLNAYYYALGTASCDHSVWRKVTLKKALSIIPESLASQPVFLSVDDTMIEKFGKKFELCSKLYDHAAHNGSNYLNGHCMVSILLSFPVWEKEKIRYLSIPLGYRLWDKENTKLEIAAALVRKAMETLGGERQVFLLCDSWYPKAPLTGLVDEFDNLDMICNVRVDTALYDLPPAKTGKRGRPRIKGDRISLDSFSMQKYDFSSYLLGYRPVLTNLWKGKTVYAIVTCPEGNSQGRRLFLCSRNPEEIQMDFENCENEAICSVGKENVHFLPLMLYKIRWNIELSYYEEKTFWSLSGYRVRGKDKIERLVNLLSVVYNAMTILPYSEEMFSRYKSASSQDTRMGIGQQIQAYIIFSTFAKKVETTKKSNTLSRIIENYILSGFRNVQKL